MYVIDAEEVTHFDGLALTMSHCADIDPSTRKKTSDTEYSKHNPISRGISRLGSGSMVEDRYYTHNQRQYLGEETEAEGVL